RSGTVPNYTSGSCEPPTLISPWPGEIPAFKHSLKALAGRKRCFRRAPARPAELRAQIKLSSIRHCARFCQRPCGPPTLVSPLVCLAGRISSCCETQGYACRMAASMVPGFFLQPAILQGSGFVEFSVILCADCHLVSLSRRLNGDSRL